MSIQKNEIEPVYTVINHDSGVSNIGLSKGELHKFINERGISPNELEKYYSVVKHWVEDNAIRSETVEVKLKINIP